MRELTLLKLNIFLISIIALSSCAGGAQASSPMSSSELAGKGFSAERLRSETSDERMIAYSVSLVLSVKNVEEKRIILIDQIKSNNGFIVRETEDSVTTRIPSENMDNFINYAKTLGSIEYESKTGTDITDQYRDNTIRLDNLKNVRNRYVALLEQANNVSEILSIEKELERLGTEIEILEGKIKHAELSVVYSSISVRFNEKTKPGPVGWVFYGLYRGIKWLFVWN